MKQASVAKLIAKLKKAHKHYVDIHNCKSFRKDPTLHARMIEHLLDDCGYRGISTSLISIEAFETKLKKARGESVSNLDNTSLEHPIPYRVLASHCLNRSKPLSEKAFVDLWLNYLITTIVTVKQNRMLIKFQSEFNIGDDWEEMYKRAGIILMEDPDFRNSDVRKQYGLKQIKRGRKNDD